MKEYFYDKLLNIHTRGSQTLSAGSRHHHPYQPTPYSALEKLFEVYQIKNSDCIVDFGSGKGRLGFYIYYFFNATVTGVEMNTTLHKKALRNRMRYLSQTMEGTDKVHFHCCYAEEYRVTPFDNRFYFFNPFSVDVFQKVIQNIECSVKQHKRDIDLILYYGSDEYVDFLRKDTAFDLIHDINLSKLFNGDDYDRFLVYRLEA
ncbi:Methyltransferase domain-containing protein [Lentibacillus persicus]|uniref:Methyltransferase domain-containing protein n=1 Tax=Lentibacillus persicus TaxID=640948 RepID=A0A1I1X311_9BACI|nr:methyltransferase [Lentibacillus persicus]SFE01722.1 Methyltransferase domain-containing protein [Lentibacillus persicus]